jgi:hypothetical protein
VPEDRPLTIPEEELSRIAAQHETDPLLSSLLSLGEASAGVIAVLVNGMVVAGALTSTKTMAEALDRQRGIVMDLVKKSGVEMPEGWDEMAEQARTMNTRAHEQRRAVRDAASERLDSFLDGDGVLDPRITPQDLMRIIIRQNFYGWFNLNQVSIVAPGQRGVIRAPVLRVNVAQVAAWWIPDLDDQGRADIALFQEEPLPQRSPSGTL